MFKNCFKGSKVLITGHTGFKGSWLSLWLSKLGAELYGIALPPSQPLFDQLELSDKFTSNLHLDVREHVARDAIAEIQPDYVFHLAAQPIVSTSYAEPQETISTNVLGAVNVLDGLRKCHNRCNVVIVTSDKCYENKEWVYGYRETDHLGGYDPYSCSKACVELVASSYRSSYFNDGRVHLATARAGNVIGGGDWAKDRIVPDYARAVKEKGRMQVRQPNATRPWQHVLEPLSGYLWLAALLGAPLLSRVKTSDLCSSFNFGPNLTSNRPVHELLDRLQNIFDYPWEDVSNEVQNPMHETTLLHLAIDKSHHMLGWRPVWDLGVAATVTALWYETERLGNNVLACTEGQIESYGIDAWQKKIAWAL